MSLPFTSLSAASATGPGAVNDLGENPADFHTLAIQRTGGTPSVTVTVQGSHDNVNWYDIGAGHADVTSLALRGTEHQLVRYVRANLVTLSGGSSPTVTATILSDTPASGFTGFSGTFS